MQLNTIGMPVRRIEWCFYNEKADVGAPVANPAKRAKSGPRRISIRLASPQSEKVFGRVLSFAKPGENFDILIKAC